jgi:hypothetical protein
MNDLANTIKQNTDFFYIKKEEAIKQQEAFYQELFTKSLKGIEQNKQMFDELGINYILTNDKGKAVLVTEVLLFKEEDKPKLVLTLIGEYKKEKFDKYYSYYRISAGVENIDTKKIYEGEGDLSIDYSNSILSLLEKRPLGEFLNNFDLLYSQELERK